MLFWLLLTLHVGTAIVARVFYVWLAVFSLFAVAVFWSFMADIFTADQGKRLFGFIGAGGTAGALLGPVMTHRTSVPFGPVNLLIAAMILLEAAVFCVWRLERATTAHNDLQAEPPRAWRQRVRGFARADAFALSARHRRLDQPAVVLRNDPLFPANSSCRRRRARRRRADADFCRHRSRGQSAYAGDAGFCHRTPAQALRHRHHAAAALPAIYIVGFLAVFLAPTLMVVLVAQVAQRWIHFAVATPARQVLYTVLGREEKYKAKNLIDVVIYRGSDALYGWMYDSLQALGTKTRRDRACLGAGRGDLAHPVGRARARPGAASRAHQRGRGVRRLRNDATDTARIRDRSGGAGVGAKRVRARRLHR